MLHQSLAVDPLSVPAWHVLALLLAHTGQFIDARVAARRLAQIDPGRESYGNSGADADLFDGGIREALEGYRQRPGPYGLMGQAMAEHTLGHAADSRFVVNTAVLSLDAGGGDGRYMLLVGHCSSATYQRRGLR